MPYDKGSNFLYYLGALSDTPSTIRSSVLFHLVERLLGGLDIFLPYARDYVKTFRGTSLRTPEWKTHLYEYFTKFDAENRSTEPGEKVKVLNSVDWDVSSCSGFEFLGGGRLRGTPDCEISLQQAWLHGEGLTLPVENIYDTTLATEAYELAKRWIASKNSEALSLAFRKEDIDGFSSNQMSTSTLLHTY